MPEEKMKNPLSIMMILVGIVLTSPLEGYAQSPCRGIDTVTSLSLDRIRILAWAMDTISKVNRNSVFQLPTVSDSVTADTAIVPVTDTALCRQALTAVNSTRPTNRKAIQVFVLRWSTYFLAADPQSPPNESTAGDPYVVMNASFQRLRGVVY
jgi:hypothetical protein